MPIYPGSRYETSDVVIIAWPDEPQRPLPYNPRFISIDDIGKDFFTYVVIEGDTLDLLAQRFGGNYEDWWKVAQINNIKFPLEEMEKGLVLIIPLQYIFSSLNTSESI